MEAKIIISELSTLTFRLGGCSATKDSGEELSASLFQGLAAQDNQGCPQREEYLCQSAYWLREELYLPVSSTGDQIP